MDHSRLNSAAYDSTELPEAYPSEASKTLYRTLQLDRASRVADMIRAHSSEEKVSVLDACSGNSALLYALDKAHCLSYGVGLEQSASRWAFAEEWRKSLNISQDVVLNCHSGVAEFDFPKERFDFAVCKDAVNFLVDGLDSQVLRSMAESVVEGGLCVISFMEKPGIVEMCSINGGSVRLWHRLDERDPFTHVLCEYTYDEDTCILHHSESYIGKDSRLSNGKTFGMRIYSDKDKNEILKDAGLCVHARYGDWDMRQSATYGDLVSIYICGAR